MRLMTTTLGLIALVAVVAQAQDEERPDPWSRVIERADQDGDGQISKEEFRGPPERFEELDANKDGFISKDEFKPREDRARRGGGGERGFARGGQRGPQPGHILVIAADKDRSGDVSEAEQIAFLASLKADDAGTIDPATLAQVLKSSRPTDARGPRGEGRRPDRPGNPDAAKLFDKDKSGKIELADIKAFFADLDKNKDGAIAKDEMPQRRRGRRGGRMGGMILIRIADKDRSGDVTAVEWTDLVNTLTDNGTAEVTLEKLQAAMPQRPEGQGRRGGRRGGGDGSHLTRMLDKDQDGKATAADLNAIFAELDKNQDGALGADEMPKRGGRGGKGGRGPKGPGK